MTSLRPARLRRPRLQRGLTLLELLVVLALTAVLATSVSYAMMAEVTTQRRLETDRTQADHTQDFIRTMTLALQGIKYPQATTSSTTAAAATTTTTATSPTSVGTTCYFQGTNDGGQAIVGTDRLTFTTTAPGVPLASINSTDDYQTQQNYRGPVGGVSEVSIGEEPIGQAPGGETGVFERVQTPSDTDPTQGGNEWLLDPDIDELGFEFWDGEEWDDTWDTTNGQTVLPQIVRVSYTLRNEQGHPTHTFTVQIPESTINANSPIPNGTPTTTTTTTTTGGTAP